MKYISLAARNNELVLINSMDVFVTHFCYSKKQRYGLIDLPVSHVSADDDEIPVPRLEIEEVEVTDEEDL